MAVELVMPRLSESMEEGTIVTWLVPDGAQVHRGEEIAEIETDKATLPYEAPESGVLRVLVPEGTTLALGQPIGLIDDLVPLPGGQSVAPPGVGAPAGARSGEVPAPRAPDQDPATASFQIHSEQHAPPHTVHASTPPPAPAAGGDAQWSPAWGPQPTGTRGAPQPTPADAHPSGEDEGETADFAALDLPEPAPRPPAVPTVRREPGEAAAPAPTPAAAQPEPFVPETPPAAEPLAQAPPAAQAVPAVPGAERPEVLAEDGRLFADVTPDQAAADAAAADDAAEPALAAMPWVDTRFSPRPAAPSTDGEPAPAPGDERRFTPDELIAPATLPPRPPVLEPTSSGNARIAASPVARRLARELGIDLATIDGTGPEGRVVRADIEAAQATGAARPPKQAAAAPSTASEFTPPIDEARAAAPIPAALPAEPADETDTAAPDGGAETTAPEQPVAPEQPAASEQPVAPDASAEALVEAAQLVAAELIESPDAVVSPPVASVDDAPAASPLTEVPPVEAAEPDEASEPVQAPAAAAEPEQPVQAPAAATPEPEQPGEPAAAPAAEPEQPTAPSAPEPPATTVAPEADPPAAERETSELTVESDLEPTPADDGAAEAEPTPVADDSAEAPAGEARVLPAAQPGRGKGEPTIVELTRQQQTVARRMAESKATIPDFDTVVEVDAAPMLALRAELTTNRPDLAPPSVNDLLVKATAVALRAFPSFNGAYRDGRLERYPRVNVGIAVDAAGTLLVPVVHDADTLSVSGIAARTGELLAKAKDGSLRPPDIASATFTVSNLGTHGVDRFTAVITPGQAGILTVGAIADRPVVRDGAVVAGKTLVLTLTTDHRAIYGVEAANFLGRIRQLLEHPTSLLA